MKPFLCLLGLHKYPENRCVCERCGYIHHDWDGCLCRKCHAKRDKQHDWDGCLCRRKHKINVVLSVYCEASRHVWDSKHICQECGVVDENFIEKMIGEKLESKGEKNYKSYLDRHDYDQAIQEATKYYKLDGGFDVIVKTKKTLIGMPENNYEDEKFVLEVLRIPKRN